MAKVEGDEGREAAARAYDTQLAAFLAISGHKPYAGADTDRTETYTIVGAGLMVEALQLLRVLVEQQRHVLGGVAAVKRLTG